MNTGQKVIDETGAIHTLARRVGAGAQGEVWLAEGDRRIVKLIHRRSDCEAMRRQFAFVRRLDLAGLHVARPIAVLKSPQLGYVAEFLAGMVPIQMLLHAPAREVGEWHLRGGSLRRRLRLLAHVGEALSALHARGVIYSDVSHRNVFVSDSVGATEAWLIDLDNLTYESDPRQALYSPGYGAPEIVSGAEGCTTLSDAWSFAVLVWQTLTLTHPFIGDLVSDGDPELEAAAFDGKLPWICHSTDRKNACSTGLPPQSVISGRLMDLARKTFETGVRDRKNRPGVSEWVHRLHSAADQCVSCSGCVGSFFVTAPSCPWCGAKRVELVTVRMSRWQPGRGLVELATRGEQLPLTAEGLSLPRRITEGLTGIVGREPRVELKLIDRGVSARALPGVSAWVAPVARGLTEQHSLSDRARVIPLYGWMVFFEPPDQAQRVAVVGKAP